MPAIRPISDLRNHSNEISDFCKATREPVFITKNGVGDMVVLSIETYERQQAQLRLMSELAKGEKSGREKGWLSIDEVEGNLGLQNS